MIQSLRYFLFGEGETAWMVYTYPAPVLGVDAGRDIRPFIYLMSD